MTETATQTSVGMGPISYLVVEFPGSQMTGEGMSILIDLVDRGLITVLDLTFVTKDPAGNVEAVELGDVDHDGRFDFAVFDGASSGLIDHSDLADAASAIEPGSSAAVLIIENRWAAGFVAALQRGGAQLVAAGYVPHDAVAASLDAAEASSL